MPTDLLSGGYTPDRVRTWMEGALGVPRGFISPMFCDKLCSLKEVHPSPLHKLLGPLLFGEQPVNGIMPLFHAMHPQWSMRLREITAVMDLIQTLYDRMLAEKQAGEEKLHGETSARVGKVFNAAVPSKGITDAPKDGETEKGHARGLRGKVNAGNPPKGGV